MDNSLIADRLRFSDKEAYIIISNLCDYNCKFCDRWNKLYKNEKSKDKNYITTLNNFIEIYDYIEKSWKYIELISIGWDETLANPYIYDILDFLSTKNKKVRIYTSWSRFNEANINKLLKYKFIQWYEIPFYWTNEKIYKEIIWLSNWYENFIYWTKKLKEAWFDLHFHTVINKFNKNDILNIIKFIKQEFNLTIDIYTVRPNSVSKYRESIYKFNALKFTDLVIIFKWIIIEWYNLNEYINIDKLPLCILSNLNSDYFNEYFESINNFIKEEEYLEWSRLKKILDNTLEYWYANSCDKCIFKKICPWYYKIHFSLFWDYEVSIINPANIKVKDSISNNKVHLKSIILNELWINTFNESIKDLYKDENINLFLENIYVDLNNKIDIKDKIYYILYNVDLLNNFDVLNLLANYFLNLGKNNIAEKIFLEANLLSGWKNGSILFNLWVLYYNIWDFKKSKQYLNDSLIFFTDKEKVKKFLMDNF